MAFLREWSSYTAGGAVEIRKSLALKMCPPSKIANSVFAPPPNLSTEILPPFSHYKDLSVLRYMTIHQLTYHAKHLMKMESPQQIYCNYVNK